MKHTFGWLAVIVAALSAFLGYIGYLGGPVFVPLAATAKPSSNRTGLAAVLMSGDLGFKIGMGREIAKRLTANGIPVVGINSLTFFRTRRTPDEVRALVTEAAQRALDFGHANRLILIGQSFGADMMHVGLTGMPSALRRKVMMVALVVPGTTVDFRASPSEMLNWSKSDEQALPTARRLTWVRTLCIYGEDEDASLCPELQQPNVRKIALPGGHLLHRDADTLYAALIAAIDDAARSRVTDFSDPHGASTNSAPKAR